MNSKRRQDICASRSDASISSRPARTPLQAATVYHCDSPEHADSLLGGKVEGYAYRRMGHPNADILAEKCRQLHGADQACMVGSGQSAVATVLLSQLNAGDHVLLSSRLYGGTSVLVNDAARFGIESSEFDCCDLTTATKSFQPNTRLVVAETISNPTLRVADLEALAKLTHEQSAMLMVDNTFATPILCRPLDWGADFVMESMTKFMNGHGDAMLGVICGKDSCWDSIPSTISKWGLAASAFDCWMGERGLETLFVRMQTAAKTCAAVFERLSGENWPSDSGIERIDFPGAPDHPDYPIAAKQFTEANGEPLFGNLLTLHLRGGESEANRFIERIQPSIPYCPSLGDTFTTLSHPASSSHRSMAEPELNKLGISSGTVRVSIGLESPESIANAIIQATRS